MRFLKLEYCAAAYVSVFFRYFGLSGVGKQMSLDKNLIRRVEVECVGYVYVHTKMEFFIFSAVIILL